MTQPGHFLPNFIDWMERVAKTPPELKSTHRDTVAHMKRASRSGVRFALEDTLPGVLPDKHRLIGENLRPPYPITIIEYGGALAYGDGISYQNVIVAEDLGTHVKLRSYASLGNAGVAICPFEVRFEYVDHWVPIELRCWSTALLNKRARERTETHEELFQSGAEILDTATSIYARLCAVLENHEVETTDVPPDARANRLRRITGHAPLYTYKTLVIGAPKKRQVVRGGGTHASPRSHMRRGYYRTSRNGVRHWVKATMVMGETPGFVHKDYRVQQQGEHQ
jgi:hypothetical protein